MVRTKTDRFRQAKTDSGQTSIFQALYYYSTSRERGLTLELLPMMPHGVLLESICKTKKSVPRLLPITGTTESTEGEVATVLPQDYKIVKCPQTQMFHKDSLYRVAFGG